MRNPYFSAIVALAFGVLILTPVFGFLLSQALNVSVTVVNTGQPPLIVSVSGPSKVVNGFGETYSASVSSGGSLVSGAAVSWSVSPATGSPTSGTGAKFSWFSPSTGSGMVTISATATAGGYQPSSGFLDVSYAPRQPTLSYVTISPVAASLKYPATGAFSATCYDQYNNPINTCSLAWRLSSSGIGGLNPSSGPSTTLTPSDPGNSPVSGTVIVTGEHDSQLREGRASFTIWRTSTITGYTVSDPVVTPAEPKMGKWFRVDVSITNTGDTAQDFKIELPWRSSDPSPGTVQVNLDPLGPLGPLATCFLPVRTWPMTVTTKSDPIESQNVRIEPGQTRAVTFRVLVKWDWIPPWSPLRVLCMVLSSAVFLGVPAFATVFLKLLKSVNLAFPALDNDFDVLVNGQLARVLKVRAEVPLEKMLAYAGSVVLTMIPSITFTIASIATPLLPFSVAAEVGIILLAELDYILAHDPPLDYAQPYTPEPVTLLNGTQFSMLPVVQSLPASHRNLIDVLLEAVMYQNATTISLSRYATAIENNDDQAAVIELEAAINWIGRRNSAWRDVTTMMGSVILPLNLTTDSITVNTAQEYVGTFGLPSLEVELLQSLGRTDQTQSIQDAILNYNYTILRTRSIILDSLAAQEFFEMEAEALPPLPPVSTPLPGALPFLAAILIVMASLRTVRFARRIH